MPYTLPLLDFPSIPNPSAPIAMPDGKPTREYVDFLQRMKAWAERTRAALDELEP